MTTHLEIETLSNDNGKSLFRSQRVRLNGKEAVTPLKALDPTKFRLNTCLNDGALGLNEIYKRMGSDIVERLQDDSNEHDRFSATMSNLTRRGNPDGMNVCILKFAAKRSNPFPLEKEIEVLTDVAHSFSDITPIPMVDAKIDSSNFPKYLDYQQTCHDTIEELNSKPIMGMLPNLPRALYLKLLEFYIERQVTTFCMDFGGRTPNHLKIRPILRYLKTRGLLDKTLIYGINARPGKTIKNTNVIPSKDFISYGFGLDALGENHEGLKRPREFFDRMKKAIDQQQKNRKRIFIKSDYGYYKTSTKDEISSMYPSDTGVKLDDILHDSQNRQQKLFNMEQQSLEAGVIRDRLNSLDGNETVLEYIEEKARIKNEIRHLKVASKSVLQRLLI